MTPDEWSIVYSRRADRDIGRLDPPVRARVVAAIDGLVGDPHSAGLIKLTNRDQWRLRVGDWRVLCRLDAGARTVTIQRVLPRGRAYDR